MITPSQLVTLNLKFSSHARPLKALAFADLVLNALFALNREANLEEITKEVARLLGMRQVDPKLVSDALHELQKDKKVHIKSSLWSLSAETHSTLQEEHGSSEKILMSVLSRHFPGGMEEAKLREWFLVASSDFFGFNGAEWLKSISKSSSADFAKPQTVASLLGKSISKYKFDSQRQSLVDAYVAFLSSEDAEDKRYIMTLGFAMLSAQLVSADLGADPITIEEIRGSTFILDTNTLFAIQLDSHRLANSMRALAMALKDIDAELVFLDTTKQEYTRVHTGRKGEIMALFREFSPEVIKDADDDFVESGIFRGCDTVEDFERFFGEIRSMPREIPSGPPIAEIDDKEIEVVVKGAVKDSKLKASIQKHCLRLRWDKRPKSPSGLDHDAALIHVTELLQKRKAKTWTLSLDRSLRAAAAERAGAHGIPVVLMLDGLIQILAVHNGGPKHSAEDFAPLLSSIVLNRCNPSDRTYNLQDLRWLHNIQERSADFAPEDTKKLLTIVKQHRLSGADANDKKLQLAIQRAYMGIKDEYDERLEKLHERAETAEVQYDAVKTELATYKRHECISGARQKLRRTLYLRAPFALVISAIGYWSAAAALPSTTAEVFNWLASVLAFLVIIIPLCWNPAREYLGAKMVCETGHQE